MTTRIQLLDEAHIDVTKLPGDMPASITSNLREIIGVDFEDVELSAAINTLESFILAYASNGLDIKDLRFVNAIQTTLDAIENNILG